MINKFKKTLNINIFQISLAGFLVAIGIISDSFIRINNLTFLTTTIYITIGMLLPLWLGLISSLLIDTFQLLFRGLIGYWFWSLQIEPLIIVIITFSIKSITFKLKETKYINWISLFLLILMLIVFIVIFSLKIDNFLINKIIVKGKLESDDDFISRLLVHYFALIGFWILFWITIYQIYKIKLKEKNNEKMLIFIIILIVSILIDWLLHPWAIQEWRKGVLDIERNLTLFRISFISGVFKSIFHILISISVIPIIYSIYNKKFKNIIKNKY